MKEFLSKDEINKLFIEINSRLHDMGKHGEILMAGGAVLTTVFNARESTRDIDALFTPAQEIRKIVIDIAKERGLRDDWLNDGVKGFLTPQMNQNSYLQLSNLTIHNVDAESLLAMKLTSARYKSNDMADSIFLMNALSVKDVEQLYNIVKKFTYTNQQTIESHYFIQIAFAEYQKVNYKNVSQSENTTVTELSDSTINTKQKVSLEARMKEAKIKASAFNANHSNESNRKKSNINEIE